MDGFVESPVPHGQVAEAKIINTVSPVPHGQVAEAKIITTVYIYNLWSKQAKLTFNVGGLVESPVPHGQVISAGAEAADGDVHPLDHHGQAVLGRRPHGERAAHVRAVDLEVREAQVQRAQLLVLHVDQVPAILRHDVWRGGTVRETVSERNGRWGWGEELDSYW